jgi:membrane protease YdiL (CAAX protease family)
MKAIVMPLLGADPVNAAYHYVTGSRMAFIQMAVFVTLSGGFGEETVYRGFLFERFRKLFGCQFVATVATVLITSTWFGLVHYPDQGLKGVEQALRGS